MGLVFGAVLGALGALAAPLVDYYLAR